jgi:hypothetical protein
MENWVPRTLGQYLLAWFLVFFSAIFYELLQVLALFAELKWFAEANKSCCVNENGESSESRPADVLAAAGLIPKEDESEVWKHLCGLSNGSKGVYVAALRGGLRLVSTTIGYCLMLVAMTFNIGLFLAVVLGFGFGTFVFAPMIKLDRYYGTLSLSESNQSECH